MDQTISKLMYSHLTVILESCVSVTLFFDQVTVGVGRPFIKHVRLSNEPRVTDVVTGGM